MEIIMFRTGTRISYEVPAPAGTLEKILSRPDWRARARLLFKAAVGEAVEVYYGGGSTERSGRRRLSPSRREDAIAEVSRGLDEGYLPSILA